MMFKAIGKPAKFVYVPTQIFDFSISLIGFIAKIWPSQKWKDALETAKIGSKSLFGNTVWFTSYCASLTILHMFFNVIQQQKCIEYYAVEDMLTTDEEEKFGSISMMDHFQKIAREGQDPFTPVYVALYKR